MTRAALPLIGAFCVGSGVWVDDPWPILIGVGLMWWALGAWIENSTGYEDEAWRTGYAVKAFGLGMMAGAVVFAIITNS